MIERHLRNPKSSVIEYEKIDTLPYGIESYKDRFDYKTSEFCDDFSIEDSTLMPYIKMGTVPPISVISNSNISFKPKYITIDGEHYVLTPKKPKLEINATIRNGATVFSATWLSGINQTNNVVDENIYKITTNGSYKGKFYQWKGTSYIQVNNFGYGEIAINFSSKAETIFFRNSEDEIISINKDIQNSLTDFVGSHTFNGENIVGRGGLVPMPSKPNMFLSSNGGWETIENGGGSSNIADIKITGNGNAVTSGEISQDGKDIVLIKGNTFLTEHQTLKTLGDGLKTNITDDYTITGNGTIQLKVASTTEIGGIKTNYTTNGRNRGVQVNDINAYVKVPLTGYNTNIIQGSGISVSSIDNYVSGTQSGSDDTSSSYFIVILSTPSSVNSGDIIRIRFTENIETTKRLVLKIGSSNKSVVTYPFTNTSWFTPGDNILYSDIYYFFYYNGTVFHFLGTDVKKVSLDAATNTNIGGIKLGSNTVINSNASLISSSNTDTDKWYAVQINNNGEAAVRVPWVSGSGGNSVSISVPQTTPIIGTTDTTLATITIDGVDTNIVAKLNDSDTTYTISSSNGNNGQKSGIELTPSSGTSSKAVIKMAATNTIPSGATTTSVSGETTIDEILFYPGSNISFQKINVSGSGRQGLKINSSGGSTNLVHVTLSAYGYTDDNSTWCNLNVPTIISDSTDYDNSNPYITYNTGLSMVINPRGGAGWDYAAAVCNSAGLPISLCTSSNVLDVADLTFAPLMYKGMIGPYCVCCDIWTATILMQMYRISQVGVANTTKIRIYNTDSTERYPIPNSGISIDNIPITFEYFDLLNVSKSKYGTLSDGYNYDNKADILTLISDLSKTVNLLSIFTRLRSISSANLSVLFNRIISSLTRIDKNLRIFSDADKYILDLREYFNNDDYTSIQTVGELFDLVNNSKGKVNGAFFTTALPTTQMNLFYN